MRAEPTDEQRPASASAGEPSATRSPATPCRRRPWRPTRSLSATLFASPPPLAAWASPLGPPWGGGGAKWGLCLAWCLSLPKVTLAASLGGSRTLWWIFAESSTACQAALAPGLGEEIHARHGAKFRGAPSVPKTRRESASEVSTGRSCFTSWTSRSCMRERRQSNDGQAKRFFVQKPPLQVLDKYRMMSASQDDWADKRHPVRLQIRRWQEPGVDLYVQCKRKAMSQACSPREAACWPGFVIPHAEVQALKQLAGEKPEGRAICVCHSVCIGLDQAAPGPLRSFLSLWATPKLR